MNETRKSLKQLFVPICMETLCFMLVGMIDTLMLSYVSDEAVGAVGTANTYISMFVIMFSIISTGVLAVMTQYIGAGRTGVAYQARQLGLAFNATLGIFLSIFLFSFAENVLDIIGIAEVLRNPAGEYLRIVGGACILNALVPVFSGYLRAFGYTRQPLVATIVGNVVNLVMNAFFLFVLQMGVTGVALATVISRFVNLLIVAIASHLKIGANGESERIENKKILLQIVKVGLPSALETAQYNIAMTLIIRFLNQMDTEGVNVIARSYTMQITNFSYCVGAALAQANAIMTGWSLGAKEYEKCSRDTRKATFIGIVVAIIMAFMLAVLSPWIMRVFTDDSYMIELVQKLLFIDIALEIGRVTNLVYGNALKTSGDALFTTAIAFVFMFLCAVGGTYFFGIRLGLLVIGAYLGMALDECVRAVCMVARWKQERWKRKSLIA
ncbi:MAG: MATE family efflux transporter [Lachnospiraceae bacterium]|nr:MATE family efflux transporter [Lachnospiraceae bacterium]